MFLPLHVRFSVAPMAAGLVALALIAGQAAAATANTPTDPAHSPSRRLAPKLSPDGAPPASADAAAQKNTAEVLRQRLAEKLGADLPRKGAKSETEVVKLVNRGNVEQTPPSNTRRQGAAGNPPGRLPDGQGQSAEPPGKAQSQAARLAAAHRSSRATSNPAGQAPEGHADAPHWDYEGEGGPQAWGELRPEYATCSSGTRQSPIDIRDGLKLDLEPIQFNYGPSTLRVIDNGHTVQVNVGAGNSIEVMGRHFELLQFHFHRPSEERIDGRRFDMVAHLVHKDLDGGLAVVAVLLNRGAAQSLIQTVWNNLPLEKGLHQAVRDPADLNALLPVSRDYYTYMGSLTTPPCTEGVLWMVMKTPVEVSAEQIGIFSRLYPMNARPVQADSGRLIKESN